MPGFVGCLVSGDSPPEDARRAACSALMHDSKEDVHSVTAGPLWLAAVGPPGRTPEILEEPGGDVLLVWGEVFGEDETSLPIESIAAYAADPKTIAPGVHGLVRWCAAERMLSLVTDHIAARPIYYGGDNGELAFSSRPDAVVALLGGSARPNPAAWFDLLAFGALTGGVTHFAGVTHLSPATCLRARAPNFSPSVQGIPLPPVHPPGSSEEALDRFVPLVKQALDRAVGRSRRVSVLSSGGMDSRLIWAALSERDHTPVSVSFGTADLPDVIVAGQICSILGVPHIHLEITPDHVRTLGSQVVSLTDASLPFLHFMGNILAARQGPQADVMLDGAKGWIDLVSPRAWLLPREKVIWHQLVQDSPTQLAALFTPEVGRLFLRHLSGRMAEYCRLGGHGSLQDCLLALDQVARRMYTQASLIKLGRVAAVSPLYDLTLNRFVAALPARLRLNKFLQGRAICAMAPPLGAIAYTGTGYPLRTLTSPYTVYIQKARQHIARMGPYDRGRRLFNVYDGWIREPLFDWFRHVFTLRTALTEALVNPGSPEALLDKHAAHGGGAETLVRLATLFLWAEQHRRTLTLA